MSSCGQESTIQVHLMSSRSFLPKNMEITPLKHYTQQANKLTQQTKLYIKFLQLRAILKQKRKAFCYA